MSNWLLQFISDLPNLCSRICILHSGIFSHDSDRTTRLSVLSYCAFSFVIIAFDEVYPLWCATERYHGELYSIMIMCLCVCVVDYFHHLLCKGGLGFSLGQIGISLSVIGGLLLPFSFFIFPLVSARGNTLMSSPFPS